MIEKKLIRTVYLENNLLILFYDESKRIAGDRCQVNLTARIQILTDQVQFTRMDPEKRSEILQTIGKEINYENKMTRNFVEEKKKEEIISAMCESFLHTNRHYLSHRQFAERFIQKTYADSLEKRKWVNK